MYGDKVKIQRKINIGFGMAKHIIEKLLDSKIIEKKDNSENKFRLRN